MGRIDATRVLGPLLLGAVGLLTARCSTPPRHEPSGATRRVEFRVGKVHGLWNFVETIRGDAHRSPILRELFRGSDRDNPATAVLLDQFDAARRDLELGVNFRGYPVERRAGRNLSELFRIQTAFARDLDDLRQRTLGLLPPSSHARLLDSLRKLEPVYDELVWNPHHAALEAYRDRITAQSRRWGLAELFRKAVRFYRAEWPERMPFTVALYALPGSTGTTSAESIGSLESVGVLLGEHELDTRFGVIFHEMCHSLYAAQPAEFQQELERMFTQSPSRHARLAYQQLNEALATALGNGWARARAVGRVKPGSWYDDAYIDGFARALYPLVTSYLEQDRAIDREFAEQAIARFASRFPEAIYDYDLLLDRIQLLVDGRTNRVDDVVAALRRGFRASSVTSSSPIDHERTLASVAASGETLVVVVSRAQQRQLDALAGVYPPLAEHLDALLAPAGDYLFSSVDPAGRAWVVIRASDADALARAIERMHDRRIEPGSPVQPL